ncbi:MAG: hypothetical protein ABIO70_30605 [Pseudomonadota bacterium]
MRTAWLLALLGLAACGSDPFSGTRPLTPWVDDSLPPDSGEADTDVDADADTDTDADCDFDYDQQFGMPAPPTLRARPAWHPQDEVGGPDAIAWAEPAPAGLWSLPLDRHVPVPMPDLVMPSYNDDMPLFERAEGWDGGERCYETPSGPVWLDEDEAWELYVAIAGETTGIAVDTASGHRSVLGLRGAYPGTFAWHGNTPDSFNDTLVLLWQDGDGRHVREFPVNTDTGAHDFGTNSSSSLRPNRRYHYQDGWHRGYNALSIDESGYHVTDDTNHNGHWDSDRNGWLSPDTGEDHERTGSGHNIHMASVDAPLGSAQVDSWSAGCQTIPGMANWTAFIEAAWEQEGTELQYFLVDTRDIDPAAWGGACVPDGTHACPYRITSFPFTDTRTTEGAAHGFDVYNCSTADEGGPEVVYLFTTDAYGTLTVSVDCDEPVDIDIHLLDGDDADACLARDHTDFAYSISPGRYLIVADTWVDEGGSEAAGSYTLRVAID